MALRPSHGTAKERGNPGPRVEVLPADELPNPLPDRTQVPGEVQVRDRGRFVAGCAGPAQRHGGMRTKGRPSLVSSLGMSAATVPTGEAFDPYRRRAASFRRAHVTELASLAGGECGTGPSSMVATASLQLAASRYLYDLGTKGAEPDMGMLKEARQQADSSRQNLLAAYELAIREGKSRGERSGAYDIDAVTRRAEAEAEAARAKRRDTPKVITVAAEDPE